jgi:hypothetical protein
VFLPSDLNILRELKTVFKFISPFLISSSIHFFLLLLVPLSGLVISVYRLPLEQHLYFVIFFINVMILFSIPSNLVSLRYNFALSIRGFIIAIHVLCVSYFFCPCSMLLSFTFSLFCE